MKLASVSNRCIFHAAWSSCDKYKSGRLQLEFADLDVSDTTCLLSYLWWKFLHMGSSNFTNFATLYTRVANELYVTFAASNNATWFLVVVVFRKKRFRRKRQIACIIQIKTAKSSYRYVNVVEYRTKIATLLKHVHLCI